MELFNANCFDIFPKIGDKTINLFVLDLPYANFKFGNCTACKWDLPIDLDKMWIEIKRIMKPNAVIVFFCNTRFGYALIDSNPKWFKYDLIWKKSKKVGFLNSNRAPLRQHENLYIFDNKEDDIELNRNLDLRAYAEKVFKFIGKTKKELIKDIGQKIDHFFRFKSSQFALPIIETYNELIEKYKINEMEGFIEYDILKDCWEKEPSSTYNPQKTEGKPYEKKGKGKCELYNNKRIDNKNKGDRHPSSILPDIELEEHENLYIFDNKEDDLELNRNLDLRAYAEKVFKFIGKTKKELLKDIGQKIDHFFRFKSSQFGLPILETYNELIEKYKINEMEGFIEYDILKQMEEVSTYNPQKTEGKEYKCKERTEGKGVYIKESYKRTKTEDTKNRHPTSILPDIELEEHENLYIFNKEKATYNPQKTEGKPYKAVRQNAYMYRKCENTPTINKGDRHPSSILPDNLKSTILEYKNPHKTIHRTQKPEKLLEWLIKTYSNEEDTVMDFCMGSGTAGVACKNTNRKFIGVEMDKEIFELAKKRIENHIH